MKQFKLYILLAILSVASLSTQAQTVTFSQPFSNGANRCPEWTTFKTALNPGVYTQVKINGTFDMTGYTCTDPTIVNAFAAAVKNSTDYISPSCGGHVWSNCNRYQSEVWIDPPAVCSPANCPAPGYLMRPCFGTSIWGGINTTTCTDVTQTMTLEFIAGPPCPQPTGVVASNILSTTATLSWAPVSGSAGYEYVIDQNAGNPPGAVTQTPNTTVNASGLTPGTGYYFHVRNKCVSLNISPWVHVPFTTLPPCNEATNFTVTNLTSTSATISWDPLASALTWDYIIDQNFGTPSTATGATNVPIPTDNLFGLLENTKYYVHIRTNCTGEQSGWMLDSFTTPIPCRAPNIMIDHLNADEAVAYWANVPTAFKYEYALTKSSTSPDAGTEYRFNNIHFSALNDGQQYFVHVRATCNSVGTISTSPWAVKDFSTFPLNVENMSKDGFGLSIYPNPAKNIITIDVKGKMNGASYTTTDIHGKIVMQGILKANKTDINISELPAGIYSIKYTDNTRDKTINITKQ